MNNKYKIILKLFLLFIFIDILLGFIYLNHNQNTIYIGTKNLTEQRNVAYLLKEYIEDKTDYNVEIVYGLDTTSFINQALLKKNIDMYVEYSSVSYIEIFNQLYTGQSNTDIIKYIKKKYSEIGISWISTLGFDNSNVLICNQYCDDNNITTYSELAQSGKFKFGAPIYFYSRSDGYNLLEDKYGNYFKEAEKINLDPTLVYSALESGDIDVGLAFSTDSKLVSGDYTILEDDRQTFPKYDAGIVVNNKTLKTFPELEGILKKTNNSLDNKIIQRMNNEVENNHISSEAVAKEEYKKIN